MDGWSPLWMLFFYFSAAAVSTPPLSLSQPPTNILILFLFPTKSQRSTFLSHCHPCPHHLALTNVMTKGGRNERSQHLIQALYLSAEPPPRPSERVACCSSLPWVTAVKSTLPTIIWIFRRDYLDFTEYMPRRYEVSPSPPPRETKKSKEQKGRWRGILSILLAVECAAAFDQPECRWLLLPRRMETMGGAESGFRSSHFWPLPAAWTIIDGWFHSRSSW